MNRNIVLLIYCLLIGIVAFTSCSSHAEDLMKGIEPKIDNAEIGPMDNKLNQAILDFTWNMFRESSQNKGNIMISSPSVYFALAMTQNGAEGDTKAVMQKTLSSKEITEDDFNMGLKNWMNSLKSDRDEAKLSIANSIWFRKGFEADEEFLKRNADYYNAALRSIDFSKKSSAIAINKWVSDATDGTIDKIVEDINEQVMMYLVNTIYFKADWKEQFSANHTYNMDFKAPNGDLYVKFMNRIGDIEHLSANGVTGVKLPYADEKFAFVGLLPEEGQTPRDLINKLTVSDFKAILNSGVNETIELSMPKFESSFEDSLKNELSNIGMGIAFDPGYADFSLMKKTREKDLYISEVKHKTFVRVDEKGTEAAAVTSVEMADAAPAPDVPKVVFNRPFVYAIIDVTTGIPLFIGIMENPAA